MTASANSIRDARPSEPKTRTRARNMRTIIAAAERIFAERGFGGTTTQAVADLAGLPKANVHYYFPGKFALYSRVLEDILEEWITDAAIFDSSDDPETVFRAYIRRKMEHSFTRPYASKLWALEVIGRGKVFDSVLKAPFLEWNGKKVEQIQSWIERGRIAPLNPQYALFSIWAQTQHYADFEYQIRAVNGGQPLDRRQREEAIEFVCTQFLRGIMLRHSTPE